MLAQIQAPPQQQVVHRRIETMVRNRVGHIVVAAAAAAADVPTAAAADVPPPVRVPRTICCSFCSESGHNIAHCNHRDVQYLYWEFMYFYRHYGEQFLSNNLSVLFEPHEAQVLLNYRPIKNIPLLEDNQIWQRMVVDSMMPRAVSVRFNKLHKKIVSMAHCAMLDYGRTDVVEPVMYQTIREFENDFEEHLAHDSIITGYHHTFTMDRHARFRRYDYDLEYLESIPMNPREMINYRVEYLPPPVFGVYEAGRYGYARTQFVTVESQNENPDRYAQPVVVARNQPMNTGAGLEPQPQWMMETPPRGVIHPGMRNVNHRRGRGDTFGDFEEMAMMTRLFDDNLKNEQPRAEVNVVSPPSSDECFECPICMTEFAHSESVSLGCCVYSFCSDCYSNQYLTKDHREHNCMMCRKPFTQIEVYEESIADKLRAKCPPSIIQHQQYYYPDNLDAIETVDFDNMPLPFPMGENTNHTMMTEEELMELIIEDEEIDTSMTLDELIV